MMVDPFVTLKLIMQHVDNENKSSEVSLVFQLFVCLCLQSEIKE